MKKRAKPRYTHKQLVIADLEARGVYLVKADDRPDCLS